MSDKPNTIPKFIRQIEQLREEGTCFDFEETGVIRKSKGKVFPAYKIVSMETGYDLIEVLWGLFYRECDREHLEYKDQAAKELFLPLRDIVILTAAIYEVTGHDKKIRKRLVDACGLKEIKPKRRANR